MMYLKILCVIGMFMVSASAAAQQPVPEIASPLQPSEVPAAEFLLPLELNAELYDSVRGATSMRLTGFPLAQGWSVDLEVEQFDVLAADAQLVVADGDREIETGRPNVVLLRGRVAGFADSWVFLGLSPHGSNGFIRLPHQSWILSTRPSDEAIILDGAAGAALQTVIYELGSLPDGAIQWVEAQCGTDELENPNPPLDRLLHRAAMMPVRRVGAGADSLPCRQVRIAIDSDRQYTTMSPFSGSTEASQAYMLVLMGAVSDIYVREVNTSFDVVYMRVWSSNNTPYSATTVQDRLTEFRNHWNSNMGSVSRHVAHLFSGLRSGAGGVAYLGQLCGGNFAYGVSGYLNGSFPQPVVNNHPSNWDLMVVAHELGHNFNAPHTHDMSPRIDGCGSSPKDCSLASQGTIMSYCHTCSGGMSNMRMDLHNRVIDERILPYLNNASCSASFLCPSDPGACCLPWGGCDFVAEQACIAIPGATFAGEGVLCAAANCPTVGACCLADGSCVMVNETQCTTVFAGVFDGSINCGEGRCASAPMLWNHGPLATNTGVGCSGRDASLVQRSAGNINRGWNWSIGSARFADEFIVPEGEEWEIDGIVLFGYHIDATSPNYTDARIQIWDGDPRDPASSVVAGNLTTNRLTSATMTNIHRVRADVDPLTTCQRRIQRLECAFQATLGPGTYWIERAAESPGTPWLPPVSYDGLVSKPNAKGIVLSGSTWSAVVDTGSSAQQDTPFVILGTRSTGECYANCDGSTIVPILNVDDFTCFINEFAAAQSLPHEQQVTHYANCDGSTIPPALNVDDFTCFINEFAQGCD